MIFPSTAVICLVLLLLIIPNSAGLQSCQDPPINTIVSIVVTDHGVVGDGKHDDTDSMRRLLMMDRSVCPVFRKNGNDSSCPCHKRIIVIIPEDIVVLSYPLNVTSYTTLQVDGILKAITNTDQWPILPPIESYGTSEDTYHGFTVNRYHPFLFAYQARHIRITGSGVIDGGGPFWWKLFHQRDTILQVAGRPNLFQALYCKDLELDTVTFQNSAFWTVHPILSRDIYIHNITIRAPLYAPNVDGIDPDSCHNVLIEHNDISCGDDHIAIKAGVCGWKKQQQQQQQYRNDCMDPTWQMKYNNHYYVTRNVTIRHNLFRTGMGIAIGSESSGGIENVHIYNNTIGYCASNMTSPTKSCGWGPALHVKTTVTRSGTIANIVFEDNTIHNTSMFILLETSYQVGEETKLPNGYPKTRVSNITFRNNRAVGTAKYANFHCSDIDPCHGIQVINNTIVHSKANETVWDCNFIQSYHVRDNYPTGLEECMAHSMNKTKARKKSYRKSIQTLVHHPQEFNFLGRSTY